MINTEKTQLDELLGRLESAGIKGVSIDSRNIKEGELFVAIKGDRFDGHDFVSEVMQKGAWGAVVQRSEFESRYDKLSSLKNIFPVEDALLSLQELARLRRIKHSIPVIGITGSNGKTTTKEMIACIMKLKGPVLKNEGNLNNHIGVPLTLLKLDSQHRSAAVEMGMSAVGEIDLLARLVSPDVGVITNIGPAHLEFLGTMDRVAEAKGELLRHIRPGGAAVLNADDHYFPVLRRKWSGQVLSFGIDQKADVRAIDQKQGNDYTDLALAVQESRVDVRLRALGRHNIYNALASACAAVAAGMSADAVKQGLEEFVPVAMRSEIRIMKGRTVLADCYNANPGSVKAALETLTTLKRGMRSVAVLGDMLELGEAGAEQHREIGRTAARLGVDVIISVGILSKLILDGALDSGMQQSRLFSAPDHATAAEMLRNYSKEGDAVLIKGSRGARMEKILEEF